MRCPHCHAPLDGEYDAGTRTLHAPWSCRDRLRERVRELEETHANAREILATVAKTLGCDDAHGPTADGDVVSDAECVRQAAEKMKAKADRFSGLLHTELLCEMAYCETCETAYQTPESATSRCPHCRVSDLEDAALAMLGILAKHGSVDNHGHRRRDSNCATCRAVYALADACGFEFAGDEPDATKETSR